MDGVKIDSVETEYVEDNGITYEVTTKKPNLISWLLNRNNRVKVVLLVIVFVILVFATAGIFLVFAARFWTAVTLLKERKVVSKFAKSDESKRFFDEIIESDRITPDVVTEASKYIGRMTTGLFSIKKPQVCGCVWMEMLSKEMRAKELRNYAKMTSTAGIVMIYIFIKVMSHVYANPEMYKTKPVGWGKLIGIFEEQGSILSIKKRVDLSELKLHKDSYAEDITYLKKNISQVSEKNVLSEVKRSFCHANQDGKDKIDPTINKIARIYRKIVSGEMVGDDLPIRFMTFWAYFDIEAFTILISAYCMGTSLTPEDITKMKDEDLLLFTTRVLIDPETATNESAMKRLRELVIFFPMSVRVSKIKF